MEFDSEEPDRRGALSRAWFEHYGECVARWRWARQAGEEHPRIKIAVMSSGVDMNALRAVRLISVQDKKNFQVSESGDGDCDDHRGHGTLCVQLLLKLAPRSHIYVAKVTDIDGLADPGIVSRSILYAVERWHVDMIILPLGFSVYDEELASAISLALRENVLCLAAPGNNGANERVAFPARLPGVIHVYATDGYGNPLPFNPSPLPGQKNFSTLGEEIEFKWKENTIFSKGTSFSVCIAGGILAMMLDCAQNHLEMDGADVRALHMPQEAEKFLELMSAHRGGYTYIAPWLLLSDEMFDNSQTKEDREIMLKSIIVAALKQWH